MTQTNPADRSWFARECAEQDKRYAGIVAEMDALAEDREQWISEFLERVKARGFHWHSDQLQAVPDDQMTAITARRPARARVCY